jgi:hypothetical protein
LSSRPLSKNMKIKTQSAVNLSVVLYGRVTWTVSLMQKRTLKVFGPKREKVIVRWR